MARILERRLATRPAPCVLDVGCAGGILRRAAEQRALGVARRARWIGVDDDPEAVAHATAAGVEAHQLDLLHDPPPDGAYDAVVFADVLEHLPDPRAVLARWLPAVCGPDTVVIASVPNVANLVVRLSLLAGRFEYAERGILDRDHLRFFTRRSASRLLTAVGLTIDRVWPTPIPLQLVAKPLAALETSLWAVTRLAPTLLAYQFVFETHPQRHVD